MKGKEVYKIWAPSNNKWTSWVRPVPFVAIDYNFKIYQSDNFQISKIEDVKDLGKNSAIIIDLPGIESIEVGIEFAKLNFIPIPVYNGTMEQEGVLSTTDNKEIIYGLIKYARILKDIKVDDNAKPAFLLDSNRMNRYKFDSSVFDNSWDIYAQDLPSAEFLIKNDIEKVLIISNIIREDLRKILHKYQKKGIKVFLKKEYELPKLVKIKKPKQNIDD